MTIIMCAIHPLGLLFVTKNISISSLFIFLRNPVYSTNEAIKVSWMESPQLSAPLQAAGFRGKRDKRTYNSYTFLPCPVGTFSNFSSKGAEACIKCPPGILCGLLDFFYKRDNPFFG